MEGVPQWGGFLSTKRDDVKFRTAKFHQIWPRHVNPCPSKCIEMYFEKFTFGGYPKNLKIEGCQTGILLDLSVYI